MTFWCPNPNAPAQMPSADSIFILGTGMQLPSSAQQILNMSQQPQPMVQPQQQPAAAAAPPIATQCFMLSNMFDPAQ